MGWQRVIGSDASSYRIQIMGYQLWAVQRHRGRSWWSSIHTAGKRIAHGNWLGQHTLKRDAQKGAVWAWTREELVEVWNFVHEDATLPPDVKRVAEELLRGAWQLATCDVQVPIELNDFLGDYCGREGMLARRIILPGLRAGLLQWQWPPGWSGLVELLRPTYEASKRGKKVASEKES